MRPSFRMPSIISGWRRLLSLRLFLAASLAIVLAVFAFANAAAQIGARLPLFEPLGPAFYSGRADLLALEIAITKNPAAARQQRFASMSTSVLTTSPLSARALRNYGLHREAVGDMAGARKAFEASDAVSRRDGMAQYWLINDAAERGDIRGALEHLDRVLRIMPEATQPLLERMAMVAANPEARSAMVRFVRADNPWLVRYVDAAVANLPNRQPLAQLFVDAGRAPDLPALRSSYVQVVEGLVSDEKIALLRRFYSLLPDARPADLHGIAVDEKAFQGGYPPVVWDLGQSSDRGGALMQIDGKLALELFGLPDTRGVTARKIIIPTRGASSLRWVVAEQTRNDGSGAYWVLKCLGDGVTVKDVRSPNLLSLNAPQQGQIALPQGCDAILVQFEIDGGTGRDPARVVFSSISVG